MTFSCGMFIVCGFSIGRDKLSLNIRWVLFLYICLKCHRFNVCDIFFFNFALLRFDCSVSTDFVTVDILEFKYVYVVLFVCFFFPLNRQKKTFDVLIPMSHFHTLQRISSHLIHVYFNMCFILCIVCFIEHFFCLFEYIMIARQLARAINKVN